MKKYTLTVGLALILLTSCTSGTQTVNQGVKLNSTSSSTGGGTVEGNQYNMAGVGNTFIINSDVANSSKSELNFSNSGFNIIFIPNSNNSQALDYLRKGNLDQALKEFEKISSSDPKNVENLLNFGNVYLKSAQYSNAIRIYEQIIAIKPDYSLAYFHRGIANAIKDKSAKSIDSSIADFKEAIRLNPEMAIAYIALAVSYNVSQDYESSIQNYNKAMTLDISYIGQSYIYLGRGMSYLGKKDYEHATNDLKKAVELSPNNYWANIFLGNAYSDKKNYEEALKSYDNAIKADPMNYTGYSQRAFVDNMLGRYDNTISDCTKTIELNPSLPSSYIYRAMAYAVKGENSEAISDFAKAIELKPGDTMENAIYYQRANVYYGMKDYSNSIKDYTQAIEKNLKDFNSYNERGLCYYHLGDMDKAIADYSKAIELNPLEYNIYDNRGISYKQKGMCDEATLDFAKACHLGGKDSCSAKCP